MMNRNILIGLVALLAANSILLAEQPAYRPGVVLVRFANEPNAIAKNTILTSALGTGGFSVKRDYTLVKGLSQVSLPAGMSVESAVNSLRQSSSVLYAEPDYKLELFAVPNDTRFGELWNMRNTGQSGGTPGADISATEAWDISTGSSNVIVAVIDTGVDYAHPDLAANMWHNPGEIAGNGIDDDNDGYIDDVYGIDTGDNDGNSMDDSPGGGHGTHVSGIIGAVGNNARGVTGVCWHVRIMAVKIADSNGGPGDWNAWVSNAILGIQYSVAKGAKVINASWGDYAYSQLLHDAIAAARDADVIYVAAAGNGYPNNSGIPNNNDSRPAYPASYDLDNIISVMATTDTDAKAPYANYGLTSVDLGAPGGAGNGDNRDILSTYTGGGYEYVNMAGTSMASPHVAGACALLLSIDPTLSYSEVKQILLNTVDPTLPGLCVSGGRLNLAAAAQEAAMDTIPPTPITATWDIQPTATGTHTITMKAVTSTDRSGVEYYFECVNDVNINSGWEPNTAYSFTALSPGTTYGFRFRARDKSPQNNLTEWSTTLSTTTGVGTDTLAPVPNPARWAITPRMIRPSPVQVRMQAETAYDESGVQYYFEETTYTSINSGWTDSSTYTINSGLSLNTNYTFHFRVRDKSTGHNLTSWSPNFTMRTVNGYRILKVPSVYLSIQAAIDDAVAGDIVEVSPYPVPPYYYQGINMRGLESNINLRFNGKAITVRSVDPMNPAIVAATIIDCGDPQNPGQPTSDFTGPRRAFIFDQGEGPDSVLAGFTIRNASVKGHPGRSGDLELGDVNGLPGCTAAGGAILCGPNPDPCTTFELPYTNWGTLPGSPTIRNCVFINCVVEGGDGGLGADGNDGNDATDAVYDQNDANIMLEPAMPAMPGESGGNGGDGGSGLGGAIYCSSGSNPIIKDCTISSCSAITGLAGDGGSGGDGGNDPNLGPEAGGDAGTGGDANVAAGGGIAAVWGSNPTIIGCDIDECVANLATSFGLSGQPGAGNPPGLPALNPHFGFAYGGGVYYEAFSAAVNISSTNFTQNRVVDNDGEGGIYRDGSGGGLFLFGNGALTATMTDCNFTGNYADTHGGGMVLSGANNLILRNCNFTNNTAVVDGGGALVTGSNTQVYDSTLTGNNAAYGGGFFLDDLVLDVHDSNFLNNTAEEGGAAFIYDCTANISSSQITGNSALMPQGSQLEGGFGGGLACWDSDGLIIDCLLTSNSADAEGGAAFIEGFSYSPVQFINCLIKDNNAIYDGGALSNKTWAWTQMINCTLVNNFTIDDTYGSGGGVSCAEDWAWVELYNSILWDNTAAYGPQIGVGTTFGSFGELSANVDVYYSDVEGGEDAVYINDPSTGAVWWWAGNFDADPLFTGVAVNQPAYYLSQQTAGQLVDSPCLNAGDPGFVSVGWLESFVGSLLTTRTDLVEDVCVVDIGYHYKVGSAGAVGTYPLTIAVYKFDSNDTGNGRLNAKTTPQNDTKVDINDPCTIQVNQGTVLNLTAMPDPGYKVQSWSGTDDDTSTALTNTVTMNSSRNVIVTFEPDNLYYLTVTIIGGNGTVIPSGRSLRTPGEVVTLTATPANLGDVVIWTGTDNDGSDGQTNTVTMTGHKNVTVQFYTARILHVGGSAGYPTIQAAIDDANDRDIIILMPSSQPYYTQDGFMIDGRDITIASINPDDPTVVASTIIQQQVGAEGSVNPAFIFQNVGPLMRLWGITISGFSVNGLSGLNGDPANGYYDGRYGSTVPAIGIVCITNASPTIKNCVIEDCHTRGGNGGNGATGNSGATPPHANGGNGGWPGGAWGGGLFCYNNSNPTIINCIFRNNSATGGNGGDGGNGSGLPITGYGGRGGGWYYGYVIPSPWEPGAYPLELGTLPKDFSGLGGAAYVGADCYPIFESCTFTNNISTGGLNGICGQTPIANLRDEPSIRYKIDNLGGAVYLASYSSADFNNCAFTANIADTTRDPCSFDGFLGYGGAVAADYGAVATFTNCSFINNTSDVGGGLYSLQSYADINDSNFSSNTASHGAGLLFCDSVAYITASIFSGNIGIISGSEGGAIGLLGSNAEVADCHISNNRSGGSGAGIYVSSKNVDGNMIDGDNYVLVKNCLITSNIADEDGGGISANWGAVVAVENCTLYNNQAAGLLGGTGFGGGLSGAYGNTYIDIINSIIWNNISPMGSQIAVDDSSFAKVRFSDVGKAETAEATLVEPDSLPIIRPGFDSNTLAATDDLSTGLIDIGFMLNFFGNQYSALYVNNNGNITFDANMMTFTPFGLTTNIGTSIIAPFFADVDTRAGNLTAYGLNTIDGHAAFGATWNNVGYFAQHMDKLNSFQVVLIDRGDRAPGDFDIEFNYEHILWETGDASDGSNGFGGESAHAGFSNGTGIRGTYYEFDGSGVPGSLLDDNPTTGLIHNSRRSTILGRYIFEVHGGLPIVLGGEPFYTESNSIDGFIWNADTNSWEPNSGSHNISTDPCFVSEGSFFLSQIAAGQIYDSCCVNAGSADVNSPDIDLSGYTTRTDGVHDVCTVDMGYHYPPFVPVQYRLDFNAVEVNGLMPTIISPAANPSNWFRFTTVHLTVSAPPTGYEVLWSGTDNDTLTGTENTVLMNENKTVSATFVRNVCDLTVIWNEGGTVTPANGTYLRGTDVSLTATPAAGYRIQSWEGTNDDTLFTPTNTVTMNGDKTVRVTFSLPQTRTVPGDYVTIQEAVEAARSGDIISVASGVYRGSTIVLNKEITVTSTNPDDPSVVAATIIDSTGYQGGLALLFTDGATANTVVDGFTITSGTYNRLDSEDATQAGRNGPDGGGIQGGTVYINTGASPTLRNCIIRDTSITAGNAGNGGNADATTPAGRGGWGGWARGGGVYVAPFANPTFVSCTVTNCTVTGGNGGNGGDSTGTFGPDYQDANHGGLWSNDFSFPWRRMVGDNGEPCYIGDYRFYSGYGGGVFCDANSKATFIGCDITNNTASGGMSGVGGSRPGGAFIPDPVTAYRIPSYGGGLYCGANSDINFVECVISGNVAPRPDATYHTDPYLGHGGGIAFEDTANIRFQNCIISDNSSAVGGGMFWTGGEPEVLNCDIMRNTAYLGGGIYAMESAGQIRGCVVFNNFAGVSPNDVDVIAGQGGGIFGSSIDTMIVDSVLTNNTSSTSGGGIHIYGPGNADTVIWNCLLTGNQAGRDGGGISTNWGAVVSVENCTLYNNLATGTFGDTGNTGFGGGLYCSYEAQTDVKNSIFWDNNGILGKQIAEGIGFVESGLTDKYYCGTVTVSYSDIQDGQAGILVSDGCPLVWGPGNMDIDPLFVSAVGNDFHLQQITAGQMLNSPCIDAGDDLAVSLGMFKYSTSTLGTSDTGIVDLGYHYPISEYCRKWDLYVDNLINFRDFAVFASMWVHDMGGAGYGTDDLKEFSYCWLEELAPDMNAPTPDPMTWALLPHAITGNSVEMIASTAVDASGQVYYQFELVGGPLSVWQTDTYYVVTGLNPTGEYCFRVRARDKYNNVTDWSEPVCVSDIGDVNAPTPAPIFVPVAAQNITREDANTASGQFQWDPVGFQWDWWHRVIVDVTGVTDDITPTSDLEVRFICSDSDYSSDNVIPATYRPIRIGYPVAIGGRVMSGGSVKSGSYRLTWNGVNQIVYEVYVDAVGGSYGRQLSWHVCVYDASNNSVCTPTYTIPQ